MKIPLTIIFALALAGALTATEKKPETPPAPPAVEVDAFNKLKAERDTLKDQLAQAGQAQQQLQGAQVETQYYKILAERNGFESQIIRLSLQLADLQKQLSDANAKVAALEAKAPPKEEVKKP